MHDSSLIQRQSQRSWRGGAVRQDTPNWLARVCTVLIPKPGLPIWTPYFNPTSIGNPTHEGCEIRAASVSNVFLTKCFLIVKVVKRFPYVNLRKDHYRCCLFCFCCGQKAMGLGKCAIRHLYNGKPITQLFLNQIFLDRTNKVKVVTKFP